MKTALWIAVLAVAGLTASVVSEARSSGRHHASLRAPPVIAQADAARRTKTCRSLRGRDLAPARRVRLVRRKTADGTDLLGCVLPRGRVHRIASSQDLFTTVYGYELRQVAGAIALVAYSYGSQYGESSSTSVWNLRTGRSYAIATHCSMLGDPGTCRPGDATAVAAFINRRGQAAAAIVPYMAQITTIAGFSSRGARSNLDSGPSAELPASSLRLAGSTATWTHSGAERSANLP